MPNQRSGTSRIPRADDASQSRDALLATVAARYYLDGLTQQEISREIGRSVATVSRLLARAENEEIVEVRVRDTVPIVPALQAALVRRFGLRTARVAHVSSDESRRLIPQISSLAARHVATLLGDGSVFAVTSGTTIHGVVAAMPHGHHKSVHVVQGVGSLGSRLPSIDNPRLIQIIADRINATPHYLPAPMVVESPAVRDALRRDPQFQQTLALGARADIVLVGIGQIDPDASILVRAGYLERDAMERIRAMGAVGDMMVEFFDLSGRFVDSDIRDRVVGMREADLRNARAVVAVAGGVAKVAAILGALRTGIVHTLVTDHVTARLVLELDESRSGKRASAGRSSSAISHLSATASDLEQAQNGSRPFTPDNASHDEEGWPRQLSSLLRALVVDMERRADAGQPASAHEADEEASAQQPCLAKLLQLRWRDPLLDALARCQERGELPPDVNPFVVADMLLGAVAYRLEVGATPLDADFVRDLLAVVIRR